MTRPYKDMAIKVTCSADMTAYSILILSIDPLTANDVYLALSEYINGIPEDDEEAH